MSYYSGGPGGKRQSNAANLKRRMVPLVRPALERLKDIIHHPQDQQTLLRAIKEVLDRVYGKSVATLEVSGPEGDPIRISAEQMARLPKEKLILLAQLMREVEKIQILPQDAKRPMLGHTPEDS